MANRIDVSTWIYTTFRQFLCPEKKTSMWTKEKLGKKVNCSSLAFAFNEYFNHFIPVKTIMLLRHKNSINRNK